MPKASHPSFPSVERQLKALGERLKVARLRRTITGSQFSERLGVSRETLRRLELGDPTIAVGTYMRALRVLGLDKDIEQVARDDTLGHKLQDLKLVTPVSRRQPSTAKDGQS